MIHQQFSGRKDQYITSRLLGKGGEGEVYELKDHPGQVLKIYSEPLTATKARKLELMVQRSSDALQTYAAWPIDLVTDKRGKPCGFVMKKLDSYVPLHMLFSPMDRKKIFPDKGYNFLVHVAGNIASAFHSLHAAGLVVGDVNEGNLLVNNQGMVAFIDCDSFQLSDANTTYYCEVGVPRYTPPELLQLHSFENVERTTSTDSFSMSILIFQLLFLGRHPFAGINHTNEDISEEAAIQRKLFAYSIRSNQKLLTPPKDSFEIRSLPDGLIQLFHLSFETTDKRPLPAEWIKETRQLLQQMTTCNRSKLHSYPKQLASCPWCQFKSQRNILYFLDDGSAAEASISKDFDRFVQGFRIDPLFIPELDLSSPPQQSFKPSPLSGQYKQFRKYQHIATVVLLVISALLFCFSVAAGVTGIVVSAILFLVMPWKHAIDKELKKRKDRYQQLNQQLQQAVALYRSPQDAENYAQQGKRIAQLVSKYTTIPKDIQLKKRTEEERHYNQQLHGFLQQFLLKDHAIAGVGAARRQTLQNAGIYNASDISKLSGIKVQGIGPKYEQALFSWQRQMASQFVYHPDNNLLNRSFLNIIEEADKLKLQVEQEIRASYGNLMQQKQHILNKRAQLQKQVTEIKKQIMQAQVDLHAFKELVK
ncbi:protein kinase [Pseudoflavitalea sp. G-6-1-2]|uniref:protein kinase domain-containing protein n=1 Tax=Pseudoflavitalea sp. G-6-1-2 TaxID=2728841 RepID=UPI00146F7B4C|nr:protein kinase [Pseudoflavitalea sp. G-6-1-2]NML20094.1 protein kinase [Pseudoflavitalea sp. G-6-1-2]